MKQRILIEMDFEDHETDKKMKELEALGYHVHSANLIYIVLDPNVKVSVLGTEVNPPAKKE